MVRTIGSDFNGDSMIKTASGEFDGALMTRAVGSDRGFGGESSRASAVVTIGSEGVGSQSVEGQGEAQFSFRGRCFSFVGVVYLGLRVDTRRLFRSKSARRRLKNRFIRFSRFGVSPF